MNKPNRFKVMFSSVLEKEKEYPGDVAKELPAGGGDCGTLSGCGGIARGERPLSSRVLFMA